MAVMPGHLLVSISSIFSGTRANAARLMKNLDAEGIPVSLLVAPHIDGNWHLAKDSKTKGWLEEQQEAGRLLILNGFDQPVQGRRAEFANLDPHEANLRLKGATRQMKKIGFTPDIFAPPRWRMTWWKGASPSVMLWSPKVARLAACSWAQWPTWLRTVLRPSRPWSRSWTR